MRIEINLDKNQIQYRVFPFINSFQTIKKENIKYIGIKKVNALTEFGGVGIRYAKNYTAYLFKGDYTLELHFGYKKLLFDIGNHTDIHQLTNYIQTNYK